MTTGEPIGSGRGDGQFKSGMKRGAGMGVMRIVVAVVITLIPSGIGGYIWGDSSSDTCSVSEEND